VYAQDLFTPLLGFKVWGISLFLFRGLNFKDLKKKLAAFCGNHAVSLEKLG
jgi:hypothetical protein